MDTGDNSVCKFTFKGEWREVENCKVTDFLISYFVADGTIELFDIKKHRLFLKRFKCHEVSLDDLFVGNTVLILSRQITITDFGDQVTRQKMLVKMQRTFTLIKPDQMDNLGAIFETIHEGGWKIGRMVMTQLTREQSMSVYKDISGSTEQSELVAYLLSGPVIIMELLGNNAIQSWYDFLGPKDPEEARKKNPSSLIARFGHDCIRNGFHGINSKDEAERLLRYFFPERTTTNSQILKLAATFKDSTCCVVKPHAFQAGLLGPIMSMIQRGGFKITGLRLVHLDHSAAEEFLEIYSGLLPEHPAMVNQLCSGSCVALEVMGRGEQTPTEFRKLAGPSDPEMAKKLRPNSLRAQFGTNKIFNAVHCTDLPEDAPLEIEYFFKLL